MLLTNVEVLGQELDGAGIDGGVEVHGDLHARDGEQVAPLLPSRPTVRQLVVTLVLRQLPLPIRTETLVGVALLCPKPGRAWDGLQLWRLTTFCIGHCHENAGIENESWLGKQQTRDFKKFRRGPGTYIHETLITDQLAIPLLLSVYPKPDSPKDPPVAKWIGELGYEAPEGFRFFLPFRGSHIPSVGCREASRPKSRIPDIISTVSLSTVPENSTRRGRGPWTSTPP